MRRAGSGVAERVTVVVATRNRRDLLARTLHHLTELAEAPPVVVVDNGSSDGSPDLIADRFPAVRLVCLPHNAGAVARNTGVRLATTPYVAFADDDSWWEPGSLGRAADALDAAPRLAVLVARALLWPTGEVDAVSRKMALAPAGTEPDLPGPSVAGFPACTVVLRRSAFLAVGGFSALLGFGGEEELLSLDLAAAGWGQAYVEEVVAVHGPDPDRRDAVARWALQQRNDALTAALRLPVTVAVARTARLARAGLFDRAARRATGQLARRLPRALAGRRPVPRAVVAAYVRAGRPLG